MLRIVHDGAHGTEHAGVCRDGRRKKKERKEISAKHSHPMREFFVSRYSCKTNTKGTTEYEVTIGRLIRG